jgi:putative acetyltransferase
MNSRVENFITRPVEATDNAALAFIIRSTLTEFGAARPGTVYYDATTDHLYELFQAPGAVYFVALQGDVIVGGAGIYPTEGLPPKTCELVKMYLIPQVRGKGLGRMLIEKSLAFAKEAGYEKVYLETMPELTQAQYTYKKLGFEYLDGPMGNSGHFGCDVFMIKQL